MRAVLVAWVGIGFAAAASGQAPHPAQRPLPGPSTRPLGDGPMRFVDPVGGDDRGDGARARPWKTLTHAATRVRAGDTLVLRGGVYRERVRWTASDAAIRSHPGELAILDGGVADFVDRPESAWEPAPGGAEGEFRSVRSFTDWEATADGVNAMGRFADGMVPLHGYRFVGDLRSSNVYWNVRKNADGADAIFCGPGVWLDPETRRVHVRLAPTRMPYLPDADNYRGPSDPRKLALVVAGRQGPVLALRDVSGVTLEDLVLRGSANAPLDIERARNLTLRGVTIYGGAACARVKDTVGLRMRDCAFRGIAAPWTFRGCLKYRSVEARLLAASEWAPSGADHGLFDIAYCEFTDSVDGVFVGNARDVLFRRNLVDNLSDDAIFVTATTGFDGVTPGGRHVFSENRFARCLTTFAFGVGHGRQKAIGDGVLQTGAGLDIVRNVFDFRALVLYHQPTKPDAPKDVASWGRFAGDHGSPTWEPMRIVHNTMLVDEVPRYSYGAWGLGNAMGRGASRRLFNNLVVQMRHPIGATFPPPESDWAADGNLFWTLAPHEPTGDPFAKFRKSPAFDASKRRYPPGWGASDRVADPRFVRCVADPAVVCDLRLTDASPARDAGVAVPFAHDDPQRAADAGKPDIGALPHGAPPARVGVGGRLDLFGAAATGPPDPLVFTQRFPSAWKTAPAALVEGYPAFDGPALAYAVRRAGADVARFEKTWLAPAKFADYALVVYNGDLARGKVTPATFSAEDLATVDAYLRAGGRLLVTRSARDVFRTPAGRDALARWMGVPDAKAAKDAKASVLFPEHPWVELLEKNPDWLAKASRHLPQGLTAAPGDALLGDAGGPALLVRRQVGKGMFAYVGWDLADSLPSSRTRLPTVAEEAAYDAQFRILIRILEEIWR